MRLILALTLTVLATSCQTSQTKSHAQNATLHSELVCSAKIDDLRQVQLTSHVDTLPESKVSDITTEWVITTQNGAILQSGTVVSSQVKTHKPLSLDLNGIDVVVSHDTQPTLKTDQETAVCTHLWMGGSDHKSTAASCNAIGTPAQGWYAGGKLIRHTRNCSEEVLSCGSSPQEGWFVQKKTERVLITSERCAWMREKPQCQNRSGISGWYLGERLLSRDDECRSKVIECNSLGRNEGWIAYKKSTPKLYSADSCFAHKPNSVAQKTSANAH